MLFKKPISKADSDRLSQLIRMKRQERPDSAFWDKFDNELRSKQLAALVRTQSWYERLGKLSLLLARKSAAATATAFIFTFGIFTISKTEFFEGDQSSATSLEIDSSLEINNGSMTEAPIFIVDDIALQNERNENEFDPNINAVPTYEVNTLTKKSVPVSYQIITEPKQFTAGQTHSGARLGAKVIRTGNHF